jgi:hypothetical protein
MNVLINPVVIFWVLGIVLYISASVEVRLTTNLFALQAPRGPVDGFASAAVDLVDDFADFVVGFVDLVADWVDLAATDVGNFVDLVDDFADLLASFVDLVGFGAWVANFVDLAADWVDLANTDVNDFAGVFSCLASRAVLRCMARGDLLSSLVGQVFSRLLLSNFDTV